MPRLPLPRRAAVILAAIVIGATGCLDGPFARANPNDPEMPIEMRIAGGPDTIRVAGEVVIYQLVTDPVVTGYTVAWSSSFNARLSSLGDGLFLVGSLPVTPTVVELRAAIGANVATRNVVVMNP